MLVQTPEKDEYSRTRQQMTAHIDVCMGGRVAEELIFGDKDVTTGASSDLEQACKGSIRGSAQGSERLSIQQFVCDRGRACSLLCPS